MPVRPSPSGRPGFTLWGIVVVRELQRLEPQRRESGHANRRLDLEGVRRVLRAARAAGRDRLTEPEGMALLEAAGIAVPTMLFAAAADDPALLDLARLRGDRVVVKVVAPSIVHKTEVGGVAFAERRPEAVASAIRAMTEHLAGQVVDGFLVAELVEHEPGPGGELLISVRSNADFGPVVSVGAGGVHAELLARDLLPGRALAIAAPGLIEPAGLAGLLARSTAVRLATEPQRGRPPIGAMAHVVELVSRLLALAEACVPAEIAELEVNPFAVTGTGLVALDVMVTPGDGRPPAGRPRRPVEKLPALLQPRSIAIAGVSAGENPGRTILRNVLRDGFDPRAIAVVKPGIESIDGCRCVPSVAELPRKVDLLVVALNAQASAELVTDAVRRDAAEGIILIPGGLEEKAGGAAHAAPIRAALASARSGPGGGPLINGGNCLGIRSRPGRYDTLFIPEERLAGPSGQPAPLAILAQSGAFAISRLSRLVALDPKYVITVGNQMDLTIGDYLEHLAGDPEVQVVGVYVEGFVPGDGRRVLAAARTIRDRGGTVILYRAGRTRAGASAMASHTASIAGDALVTAALARQAGVLVADTLGDFDDLLRAFTLLSGRSATGPRLGALSNAGFECVAIADNLGTLALAAFDPATAGQLGDVLRAAGVGDVVDIHNPLDLTPMAGDAQFAAAATAILECATVDVALIGNVPFTPTLRTVPVGDGPPLDDAGSVAAGLLALWRRTSKAWVTVVDAGPRYDPLARVLEAGGIPTFRTADAALRTLGAFVEARRYAPPSPRTMPR